MSNAESQVVKQICANLRVPQADSLKILADVLKLIELDKDADIAKQLEKINAKYPDVKDFARNFVCLCFALATGVGKTRLMGAFIAYLHKIHQVTNFMIIAPNVTIYNKLIEDFSEGSPKYVFRGMGVTQPVIIKDECDYKTRKWDVGGSLWETAVINIFNIQKLVREDDCEIRKLSETIGESYFGYLSSCSDLVLLMDEAHHYRESRSQSAKNQKSKAYKRAIDELNPVLGLELTATPFLPGSKRISPKGKLKVKEEDLFHNVIYNYDLAHAIRDGFVKIPAVVTRENFNPGGYEKDSEALEQLKLKDGILLHERTKTALKTYAFNHGNSTPVKPFMLVVAGDIAHAESLRSYLVSDDFCNGAYKDKTIIIHSALERSDKSQMVKELQDIEKPDNKIEIVVHVSTLSEGWDVKNLYTLVPLRAANSPLLVFQSLGRGLRLPYGKRVGDPVIDRFRVVSHDNFDAIVKEAENQNLRLESEKIKLGDSREKNAKPILMKPKLDILIEQGGSGASEAEAAAGTQVNASSENQVIADIVAAADAVAGNGQSVDMEKVAKRLVDDGRISPEAVPAAVKKIQDLTMSIPRIVPRSMGTVQYKFHDFNLETQHMPQTPIRNRIKEKNLASGDDKFEKYDVQDSFPELDKQKQLLVSRIRTFDKINYNDRSVAQLLQKLVLQYAEFLKTKLSESEICNIFDKLREDISRKIYTQMLDHVQVIDEGYDYIVESGYLKLRQNEALIDPFEKPRCFRNDLARGEKERITSMVFGGFQKCLYDLQKFDSDSERLFSCLLERDEDVIKWFRPALTDFAIRCGEHRYKPDFVVEAADGYYICEVKKDDEINAPDVLSKKDAAVKWCKTASEASQKSGKNIWKYLLIPHSKIDCNLDFSGVKIQFLMD